MKKEYSTPDLDVVAILDDVVTASPNDKPYIQDENEGYGDRA